MLSAIPLISNHFLVADAFFVVVELPLFLFEGLALLAVFSLVFLSELESATFFLAPDLKSVSYQPLPLRRKAAAETNFFIVDFLHFSHFFSGLSLIFCSSSVSKPQFVHWYS